MPRPVTSPELRVTAPVRPATEVTGNAIFKLLAEVTPLPSSGWFEVPAGAYVLTPPPEVITTRNSMERRTVLTRVDPKDHATLEAARKNTNPTEKDVEALNEIVDRVLDSEP